MSAKRASVPVHVLSGGDREVSIVARPQQQVASLGLPLEQDHRFQTGNIVVTPGTTSPRTHLERYSKLKCIFVLSKRGYSRGQVSLGTDVRIGAGSSRRRKRLHPHFFLLNSLFQHVDLTWEQIDGGRHGQLQGGGWGGTCPVILRCVLIHFIIRT